MSLRSPRTKKRFQLPGLANVLLPLTSVVVMLLAWELAPRVGLVRSQSVPPFSQVVVEMTVVLSDSDFLLEVLASGSRWLKGLAIAMFIGIPLGLAMGRYRFAFMTIDPVLTVAYPVPKAALILPLVLIFGAGDASRVTIIVIGALLPIVTSSYHGAKAVDPWLIWSARAFGGGRWNVMRKVVFPASAPSILSGLRLAIAISIFVMLASELLIRQSGVGAYLFRHLDHGRFLTVWATSTIIASIGFMLDWIFARVVRFSLPWHEGEV